jgi:hypothetical protein
MQTPHASGAWKEIGGGLRPSTILIAGAVLGAAGPLIGRVGGSGDVGWWVWGAGLGLVALGLGASGVRPWLTTFAVVAGAIHAAQLLCLIGGLGGLGLGARCYQLLVVPKTLSLVLLALLARRQVAPWRRYLLLAAASLAAIKPALREFAGLGLASMQAVDLAVGLTLALALIAVAVGLRHRENEWARRRFAETSASLADFDRRDGPGPGIAGA